MAELIAALLLRNHYRTAALSMIESPTVYADIRLPRLIKRAELDLALKDEVTGRLAASPFAGLRRIRCEASHGAVIFSGVVSSFYLKQLATAIGQKVDGVRAIRNDLHVQTA